jgi:AraC family transcriptional regulator, L-rhamnose operon regulatory protein RhaS
MMIRYTLDNLIEKESFPFCIQRAFLKEDFEPHYHDFSELVIVIGGKGIHTIDNKEYSISSGDIYVLNGNTSHGFSKVDNLEICNIMYDLDRMIISDSSLKQMIGFQALFVLEPIYRKEYSFKSKLKLSLKCLGEILELLNIMFSEYEEKKECYESMLRIYFMKLIVLLSREYNSSGLLKDASFYQLAELISYIEKHFTEDFTVKQMAEKLGFSERHFTRIFKEIYNTSPIDYLIKLRLKQACSLLMHKNITITEAAVSCGFDDSNYFTRCFKKYYGITPGQYKKLIK